MVSDQQANPSENSQSGNSRLHALIEGRVQGVGFRYFVVENAEHLGLTGWVRNLWDEKVELTAEGPRPALEKLLKAVYRGPSSAFVTTVDFDWLPATGEYEGFQVVSTY